MFKKRYLSAHSDFKTGFYYKLSLFVGLLFVIIFIFFKGTSSIIGPGSSGIPQQIYDFAQTTYPDSILALGVIFLAVGIILYFFCCQVAKLTKIADEIEKGENLEDFE